MSRVAKIITLFKTKRRFEVIETRSCVLIDEIEQIGNILKEETENFAETQIGVQRLLEIDRELEQIKTEMGVLAGVINKIK